MSNLQVLTHAELISEVKPRAQEVMRDSMAKSRDTPDLWWYYNNGLCRVKGTDSWQNEVKNLTSTRMWPQWDENHPIPVTEFARGVKTIFELAEYVDSIKFTRRYKNYVDRYAELGPNLAEQLPMFMERGLTRHSQLAALIYLTAFDTTVHIGADNKALCANDHSVDGLVEDNLLTDVFSPEAIEVAADLMAEMVDGHGVPVSQKPDILLTGPKLFFRVKKAIKDSQEERQFWNELGLQHRVCPWLIEKIKTGASDYWFLISSNAHTVRGYVGEYPTLIGDPFIIDEMNFRFSGITSGVYGWMAHRGVVGSIGTGA